jgi:signal transduction histidine kinase
MSVVAPTSRKVQSDVDLDAVIATSKLTRRPTRLPDYQSENSALIELAEQLVRAPEQIYQRLVHTTLKLCKSGSAGLTLLEGEGKNAALRLHAIAGGSNNNPTALIPIDECPCGVVLKRNALMLFDRYARYFPRFEKMRPQAYECLISPFVVDGIPVGTLWASYHDRKSQFDAEDARLLVSLSKFASVAYQTINSFESIRTGIHREEKLRVKAEALYQFVDRLNRAPSVQEVYQGAMSTIIAALKCDRVSILLFDESGTMRFKAWQELSEPYRQAVQGHSPWPKEDPNPQPICIEDVRYADLDETLRSVVLREGLRAMAFIPVVDQQTLLGKFMVYYNEPHVFTQDELQLAQAIASQLAFAIQRKRAEEVLRQAEETIRHHASDLEATVAQRTARMHETIRSLDSFCYSLAHDLRAPLRAMAGFSGQLISRYSHAMDDEGKHFLHRIEAAAKRMDQLTKDLLELGRLDTADLTTGSLDIEPVLHRALAQLADEVRASHCLLELERPFLRVLGNPVVLEQVFVNLLSNALKFVPSGVTPRVIIRTEVRDNLIRVTLRDNGLGIRAEYLDKLFRPFVRMVNPSQFPGTGMGLAIVRKAVERMGGCVGVESELGKGSCFWFELPASMTANSPAVRPWDSATIASCS